MSRELVAMSRHSWSFMKETQERERGRWRDREGERDSRTGREGEGESERERKKRINGQMKSLFRDLGLRKGFCVYSTTTQSTPPVPYS